MDEGQANCVRVGVMLDGFVQPRWREYLLQQIADSNYAQLTAVILKKRPVVLKKGLLKRIYLRRAHLLFDCYERLDQMLFAKESDPFALVDVSELLAECDQLHVVPKERRFDDVFSCQDIKTIEGLGLDVIIRFGFRIIRGEILDVAKHGVWSYHHGDNRVVRGSRPCAWEVLQGRPTTGSVLQVLTNELDGGQVLYRSQSATDQVSITRTRHNVYWKTSHFVGRKLRELASNGRVAEEHDGDVAVYSSQLFKRPKNLEMARLLVPFFCRTLARKTRQWTSTNQWCIYYRFERDHTKRFRPCLYQFKPLFPPRGRIWADPFPLKHEGRYFVFCEEKKRNANGQISVIEFNSEGEPESIRPVLSAEWHLSYPFVFEHDGHLLMIPESAEHRTVDLYVCDRFPDKSTKKETLLNGIKVVDATIAKLNGQWCMFVNVPPYGGVTHDELHLFFSDTPYGPWRSHERNPIKSDATCSRPAGRVFSVNGKWFRPSQDCSVSYGRGVVFNRIARIDNQEYSEHVVARLDPSWDSRLNGTHTFNVADELIVVDARRRISKWLPSGRNSSVRLIDRSET